MSTFRALEYSLEDATACAGVLIRLGTSAADVAKMTVGEVVEWVEMVSQSYGS